MKIIKRSKNTSQTVSPAPTDKWKVLIVDDEPDIHAITQLGLKNFRFDNKPLQLFNAKTADEAKEILQSEADIAIALIDVVMETDHAGLQLVEYIRNELHNDFIRLIIRTGQPGLAPEQEVLERYDIDDYKEKTELTEQKLYTSVRSALKSYRDLNIIQNNRLGLKRILDAAPMFYQRHSFDAFFHGVLTQLISLCNLGSHSFIATINSGFVVSYIEGQSIIYSRLGRFADLEESSAEIQQLKAHCQQFLTLKQSPSSLQNNLQCFPLKDEDNTLGFIVLENANHLSQADLDLINIMLQQCVSALKNLKLYQKLKKVNTESLKMLAIAAEHRDTDTGDHILRIVHNTTQLALALNIPEKEAEHIGLSSTLHDVGKIGIPDAILQKPGKLTKEEFEIMKTHSRLGWEILDNNNSWFDDAREIALSHHEKWDGSGYPSGLKGEEIPLVARIVAIIDVFDALTNKRVYKPKWSIETAVDYIIKQAGQHFDPKLVEAFKSLHQQGKILTTD